MLGGNDAELDRLVAALEAEDEERAAAAERRDSDVAMQLHEAELVDAGLLPSVATSRQMANVLTQLEAAEISELKAQAAFRARKKKLEDQNAKRHALRQHRRVSMRDLLDVQQPITFLRLKYANLLLASICTVRTC